MTKEFIQEHNFDEVSKQLEVELQEFSNHVATYTTENLDEIQRLRDELLEMERQLIPEQDAIGEYIRGIKYALPSTVTFDNENYSLSDITKAIIYFLNKRDVEWQYTLGLYELVKFWKSKHISDVEYGIYDSTIRILNQGTFKGYNEWKDIQMVNEFFKSAHDSWKRDTSWVMFASQKHNIILDQMQVLDKIEKELSGPGVE